MNYFYPFLLFKHMFWTVRSAWSTFEPLNQFDPLLFRLICNAWSAFSTRSLNRTLKSWILIFGLLYFSVSLHLQNNNDQTQLTLSQDYHSHKQNNTFDLSYNSQQSSNILIIVDEHVLHFQNYHIRGGDPLFLYDLDKQRYEKKL